VIERAALFAESPRDHRRDAGPSAGGDPAPGGPRYDSDRRRRHAAGGDAPTSRGCSGGKRVEHLAHGGPAGHRAQYALRPPREVWRARPSPSPDSSSPDQPSRDHLDTGPAGTHVHWEHRGITLLRAALDEPEGVDAWSQTSRALEIVIDKLQTFGGRIEEVTPTGILASFGVDPVDSAPRRAAHAAIVIHKVPRAPVRARAGRWESRSASMWLTCLSDARRPGSTSMRMRSERTGRSSANSCRPSRRT
jgi:hypothetical protein